MDWTATARARGKIIAHIRNNNHAWHYIRAKTNPAFDGARDSDGYLVQSKDYEYTCGTVALLNYLEQFHGAKNLIEREVSKNCGVTVEDSATTEVVRAAQNYGLTNAAALVISFQELEKLGQPVIV